MSSSSEELVLEDGTHGSSEGQDRDTVWTLSGTTMKAYVAMRGLPDMEDPLMTWIASMETDKRVEGEVTMLGDIENSIKERFDWKARGPATYDDEEAQRKSIFTFERPIIEHFGLADLELPEGTDTGKSDIFLSSDCAADGWRKYAASDVSDDGEGDPADGWITPDTFAQWSRGTKRWDVQSADKYRSTWEGRKTYEIPVTLNPSMPPAFFTHLFDRMDPELMRLVRMNNTSPEPSWGVRTASEPEYYGPAEVDAAIERLWGAGATQEIIASKQREVAHLVQTEEEANAEAERLRHEARRLKHENRKLADCFAEHRSTRDRRIMKQVHRHIRELSYIARAKLAEIRTRVRERDELQRELDAGMEFQRTLLEVMGKDTPEEVFAMYPNIWEPEEIRKNRRNYS
ncbi:hypothetical protein UCDDA912_g05457 [Diaporthe ampelina]|uniref:Uncharacterized protein n=1 Tax=Diaporthe ampelina TaxID=1214573 RepID=A0A0G2I3P0_9PEZI|nr:hypothetical protein UCDDA912_g05457 [Diaporthe ampelina]